jgi:hypothetical protein
MPKVRRRRLVIDACVGRAAGDRSDGASFHCTAFLTAVFDIGHSAVMSGDLLAEWNRNKSRFARTWLRKMYGARKVITLAQQPDTEFRERIERAAPLSTAAAAMRKDCHLLEAARATDRNVVSIDEKARGYFHAAAAHVRSLREVCWVNPAIAEEQPLDWLRQNAPLDRHRMLGAPAGRRL